MSEEEKMYSPEEIRKYATSFPPDLRNRVAVATRVYKEVRSTVSDVPFAHAFVLKLAEQAEVAPDHVRDLGLLLREYPQLSFETTADLGEGNLVALPLDSIAERQRIKVRTAQKSPQIAGVDIDKQAAWVRETVQQVINELDDASTKEGIPMRMHVYKALQDSGYINSEEKSSAETLREDDYWWTTIIPNYITGLILERIASERIRDIAKKN